MNPDFSLGSDFFLSNSAVLQARRVFIPHAYTPFGIFQTIILAVIALCCLFWPRSFHVFLLDLRDIDQNPVSGKAFAWSWSGYNGHEVQKIGTISLAILSGIQTSSTIASTLFPMFGPERIITLFVLSFLWVPAYVFFMIRMEALASVLMSGFVCATLCVGFFRYVYILVNEELPNLALMNLAQLALACSAIAVQVVVEGPRNIMKGIRKNPAGSPNHQETPTYYQPPSVQHQSPPAYDQKA